MGKGSKMTTILAVDPGKSTGWAFFREGKLAQAGLIDYSDLKIGCFTAYKILQRTKKENGFDKTTKLIIEIPQVYQQKHWKGDPDDLIGVAVIAGLFINEHLSTFKYPEIIQVHPHQWKGNRPKAVDNKTTLALLSLKEMAVIEDHGAKSHNVIDAIGIGLWHLGRR